MFDFLEVLDRVHSGPVCTVKEWDTKIIPTKISEKLKEHGLEKTCTPENPVNTDDGLADEFWRAGFELAVDIGMLCLDTERIVKVSKEELKDVLRNAPKELPLGEGSDRVVMPARKPEEKTPPLYCAPIGITVSEDLWIPLVQGVAQNREIDLIQGGTLKTVFGRPVVSGTPYETLAGRVQAQMHREALWRAGRPGMGATAVVTSPTVFGQLGGYGVPGGYKPNDIALILSPAVSKTTYVSLHKVAHTINCGGRNIMSGCPSMIGGYAGSPEGVVISNIGVGLLNRFVHRSVFSGSSTVDLRYLGSCGREAQWAVSIGMQAMARNANVLITAITNQVAGPCTDMLLYETTVAEICASVSGASLDIGTRSGGGKYTDYITPLECKYAAEVIKSCAGMKRSDANDIINGILPKYEDKLRNPPKGKSFAECFDIEKLEPTKEWLTIYQRVKEEMIDMGVPLQL